MILPTKHIREDQALLGVGQVLLKSMNKPQTVVSLWEDVRNSSAVGTYHRFVLALDLLYVLGAIIVTDGQIVRAGK